MGQALVGQAANRERGSLLQGTREAVLPIFFNG